MPNTFLQSALRAGVTDEIANTFKLEQLEQKELWDVLYKVLPTTAKEARNKLLSFKSPTVRPSLWPYGTPRDLSGIKDYFYQIATFPYQLAITWNGYDEVDDLIGDLRTQASEGVKGFFQLPDRMYSEYLNGTASLNPSLYNAYTGVSMFSTVDGDGNDLFGASGGNIVVGSGTSSAAIQHDLLVVNRRAASMVLPVSGAPIFTNKDVAVDKMFVIAPLALNEEMLVAAESKFFKRSSINNTSEDNVLLNKFQYITSPYLTDANDWFVVIQHPILKPFILRAPDNVETFMADESNSDRARMLKEFGMYMSVRTGMVPYMQCSIFKVSNT